jgi:hypothetical protein
MVEVAHFLWRMALAALCGFLRFAQISAPLKRALSSTLKPYANGMGTAFMHYMPQPWLLENVMPVVLEWHPYR